MTYKEFKREIELLGYNLLETEADIVVIIKNIHSVLISKHSQSGLQTTSGVFNLIEADRAHLLTTAANFANTPIGDR